MDEVKKTITNPLELKRDYYFFLFWNFSMKGFWKHMLKRIKVQVENIDFFIYNL